MSSILKYFVSDERVLRKLNFVCGCMGLALFLMIFQAVLQKDQVDFKDPVSTTGTIGRVAAAKPREHSAFVEYSFAVEGKYYQKREQGLSKERRSRLRSGESVPVVYERSDPSKSSLGEPDRIWNQEKNWVLLGVRITALALVILGFGVLWTLRPGRKS